MILYYALGGGLGHISRAYKVLSALALKDEYKILTSSTQSHQLISEQQSLSVPEDWLDTPHKIMELLRSEIDAAKIKNESVQVFVDSFPFGIIGELDLPALSRLVEVNYVARFVQWSNYSKYISSSGDFSHTYVVDVLHPEQQAFIDTRSKTISSLALFSNLSAGAQTTQIEKDKQSIPKNAWLVMHSGPDEEVEELLSYARDIARVEKCRPKFVLISLCEPKQDVDLWIKQFPHCCDISVAAKIFTAAGYNSMLECFPYRDKHLVLPFPRKYDDQFARARLWKSETN